MVVFIWDSTRVSKLAEQAAEDFQSIPDIEQVTSLPSFAALCLSYHPQGQNDLAFKISLQTFRGNNSVYLLVHTSSSMAGPSPGYSLQVLLKNIW